MTTNTAVMPTDMNSVQKFRFFFTMAIGLGFATTAITWTHYNGTMIGLMETHFQPRHPWLQETFLGFLMAWDNIIAIFLQPWIGARSDNTRTRFGKRTPYIMVGIPLAAIFFALIPIMKTQNLAVFILVVLAFNMSMAIYRSPTVALLPDLTPSVHRTKGNAVINLMGGIFAGIALFVGGSFVANGQLDQSFAFVSLVMILCLVGFLLLVKEPKELEKINPEADKTVTEVSIIAETKLLFVNEDKSKLFMLLAIATWFISWNALEVWFPPYIATIILGETRGTPEYLEAIGEANSAIFLVPVVYVITAIIGGYLGYEYGRKPVIMSGLLIFIVAMIFGSLQTTLSMVAVSFIIAGVGWGLMTVNSIVIVWELSDNVGAGTGLYYLASSLAAITGPILFGLILEVTESMGIEENFRALWFYSITFLVIAFICMFKVTSGDMKKDDFKALDAISELD